MAYWEPTKWAQRLRATIANGEEVLLKMDLAAGHAHSSHRYHYLHDLAFEYAFLLEKLHTLEPGAVGPTAVQCVADTTV